MSTATSFVSDLAAHRERMSKLFFAPGNRGHGSTSWYKGTHLDDNDDFSIENMFPTPLPPTPPPSPPPPPPSPSASITSITPSIQSLAMYINQMAKKKDGLPSRNTLRKDKRLAGEISRKTGALKVKRRGGRLRAHVNDERLFDAGMWAWLLDVKESAVAAAATTKEEEGEEEGKAAVEEEREAEETGGDAEFVRELVRDDRGLRARPSRS